jgi:hypothetical protein
MTDLNFQNSSLLFDGYKGTVPSQILFNQSLLLLIHCMHIMYKCCINTRLTTVVNQICGAVESAQVMLLEDKC